MDENLLIEKNWKKVPIISTIFLVLVLIFTLLLFIVNKYLQSQNEKISESIGEIEKSLSTYKKDKNVQVYELLKNYDKEIKRLEKNSDIVTYLNHLWDISKKYSISFSWFSMSNGEIKTKVEARKNPIKNNTYSKVWDFISWYREDKTALFELKFINSFEWMDTINFDVNFKIKNDLPKNQSEIEEIKQ